MMAHMQTNLACPMCESKHLISTGVVESFEFFSCQQCDLTFTPQPRAQAEHIYEARHGDTSQGVPTTRWADTTFLEPLWQHLNPNRPQNILDFGCGRSVVPEQLRAQGHEVIGIDIYPPEQPRPDRLTGNLLDLALASDRFDLAYAFQVFEHLPKPRPFLEELLRVTRVGGLVMIHTDMEVPEREAGFEHWWYVLPPQHCTFYRHRTFELYLAHRPHHIIDYGPKHVLIQIGAIP